MSTPLKAFCFFFIQSLSCFTQNFDSHFPDSHPIRDSIIPFNDSAYLSLTKQRYGRDFGSYGRRNEFIYDGLKEMKDIFKSGSIGTSYEREVTYMKKLLRKTVPAEMLPAHTKIFIRLDPTINAFCTDNSYEFFNLGLLAFVDTEAELASVIGHEFGHYLHRHASKQFRQKKNTDGLTSALGLFGGSLFYRTLMHKWRKMEKQADLTAVGLFRKNNYQLTDIPLFQMKMEQQEKLERKLKGRVIIPPGLRTHPYSKKRYRILKKRISKFSGQRESFQVDTAAFLALKKRAIDECINNYFSNCRYDDCIELAYRMHLQYPGDEFYLYFVLEPLRRLNQLVPGNADKRFITHRYRLKKHKDSLNRGRSIHFHLTDLYPLKDSAFRKWPENPLLNTREIEFVTNKEAQKYFTDYAKSIYTQCKPQLSRLDTAYIDSAEKINYANPTADYFLRELMFDKHDTIEGKKSAFFLNNHYRSRVDAIKYRVLSIDRNSRVKALYDELNNNKSEEYRSKRDSVVDIDLNLEYWEKAKVVPMLNFLSKIVARDNYKVRNKLRKRHIFYSKKPIKTSIDFKKDLPELYRIAQNNGLNNIYFADLLTSYRGYNANTERGKTNILLYCVNFNANEVCRVKKKVKFKHSSLVEYANLFPDLQDIVFRCDKSGEFRKLKYKRKKH